MGPGETSVRRRRDLIELTLGYALIVAVIWTPRPLQRLLFWLAAVGLITVIWLSFAGWEAMGLRSTNLLRSLWVTGIALLAAAIAICVADRIHTMQWPGGLLPFLRRYLGYAIWAMFQQVLLQDYFLARLLRLLGRPAPAALAATALFSLAHLPNPILTAVTFVWGLAACLLFLRYRNLYPLALAHAILGIAVAMTLPGPLTHNMRVGLGYLTYSRHPMH
jgi:membrane protease YdiL (CAAX protease family)